MTEPEEVTPKKKRRSTPTTAEAYEARLIGLAYSAAEKQLIKGEASSQVITHLLKAGSVRDELEKERLRNENLLIEAKIGNLEQMGRIEDLLIEAKAAMTSYQTGIAPGGE